MPMGPVEYVIIGFPGNQFKGEIVPALTGAASRAGRCASSTSSS